ncbi:MAG: DUF6734 family protein [Sediminibacterium sp.]
MVVLHLDGDVFIFKEFDTEFLNNSLLAQEPEISAFTQENDYNFMREQLLNSFSYFPDCVKEDLNSTEPIRSSNAGVLGGNDLLFFEKYCRMAYEYIDRNLDKMHLIDVSKFCVFFEQQLFYSLSRSESKAVTYLFPEDTTEVKFGGLANFWEVPARRTFLHLLGDYKKKTRFCKQMAELLRDRYPETYYLIISLFQKNKATLKFDYYPDIDFNKNSYSHYLKETILNYTKSDLVPRNEHSDSMQLLAEEKEFIDKVLDTIDYKQENLDKDIVIGDHMAFFQEVDEKLQRVNAVNKKYLYGRDLVSFDWYKNVFSNGAEIFNKLIISSPEIEIIESRYNWGFYLEIYRQSGFLPKPQASHILDGECCYTAIVPEAGINDFSIYYIEKFDLIILKLLAEAMSIGELFDKVLLFFETDIVINEKEEVKKLLCERIEFLFIRKVVRVL